MHFTYRNHSNIHTNNNNANGALRDVLHRLYQGVLYFQNVMEFAWFTCQFKFIYSHKKTTAFLLWFIRSWPKLTNIVLKYHTGNLSNWRINVDSAEGNVYTPISTVCSWLRRCPWNLQSLSTHMWVITVRDYTQIEINMYETRTEFHLRSGVKCDVL
jgi:hypothetical protein